MLAFAREAVVFKAAEEDEEVGTKASTESACAALLLDKAIRREKSSSSWSWDSVKVSSFSSSVKKVTLSVVVVVVIASSSSSSPMSSGLSRLRFDSLRGIRLSHCCLALITLF